MHLLPSAQRILLLRIVLALFEIGKHLWLDLLHGHWLLELLLDPDFPQRLVKQLLTVLCVFERLIHEAAGLRLFELILYAAELIEL